MRQLGAVVLRVVLLPFRLLRGVGRLAGHIVGRMLWPVLGRLDRSPALSRLINRLSSSMATQRGLLLLIGTLLVALSLAAHVAVVVGLVVSDAYDRTLYWLCIPFALLHIGVLIGFTGIMLAIPLGQGYRSQRE